MNPAIKLALILHRNAVACRLIDRKVSGIAPEERSVVITENPASLMEITPRKPATSKGENYITVVRHGRQAETATIHGALELSNPPFEIKLDKVKRSKPKWFTVESPSASSLVPQYCDAYYNPEIAPRKRADSAIATLGAKPESEPPMPRFYRWPEKIPVW